jgi:hypothetical protein
VRDQAALGGNELELVLRVSFEKSAIDLPDCPDVDAEGAGEIGDVRERLDVLAYAAPIAASTVVA